MSAPELAAAVRAAERPAGARRAVVSTAVAPVVDGPTTSGHVLAAVDGACYLALDDAGPESVLAIVGPTAVRLPNALVLRAPLPGASAGVAVTVGAGSVWVGRQEIVGDRRFDPRPRLGATTAAELDVRSGQAATVLADAGVQHELGAVASGALAALGTAADELDGAGAAAAADRLLGAGPGLTPAGDDVLAGFLAAVAHLPGALERTAGAERVAATATAVRDVVLARLARRTPAVSAALLAHAAQGCIAAPAAATLAALTGGGDVVRATERLRRVGHTSGAALGTGLLLGVRATLAATAIDDRAVVAAASARRSPSPRPGRRAAAWGHPPEPPGPPGAAMPPAPPRSAEPTDREER